MDDPIADLVRLLARLPGIGERTASRLAFHILGAPREYAQALGQAVAEIHQRVRRCRVCGNYTAGELCAICADVKRDPAVLCVVARPPDVIAVERSGKFRGRYFVLHGLLSPLDGMGPEKLSLQPLLDLVSREKITEVIVATPLSVDGEATSLYLVQALRPLGVLCSRIASGMPHGGELEYTDQITLARALEGRREV
jgi:recombination protein RecR